MSDVTRILSAIEAGDPSVADQLLPLVYDELRKLAAQKLAQEKPGQTLEATALVHEAYLRLVGQQAPSAGDAPRAPEERDHREPLAPAAGDRGRGEGVHWNSRGHFFAAAAEAMRRLLVENARRKLSKKRGAARVHLDLDQLVVASSDRQDELLDIDAALAELTNADPEAAQLVKLRYFAGLSIPQAAAVLGVSPRKADFLWAYARAWLLRALGGADGNS